MPDFADDTTTEVERKAATLRWVALIETVSYVVLFSFWMGGSKLGTAVFGSLHGMIFLAFAGMVLGLRAAMDWSWEYVALAIVTGPIGAVLVYARLRRAALPVA